MIDVGKKAPAFTLKDQDGVTHKLSHYAGVPSSSTSTRRTTRLDARQSHATSRTRLPKFVKAGNAVVLGVSILDEKSKARFATKHGLTFPLLADPDHEVAERYGVWQEKMRYGRKVHGHSAHHLFDRC